MYLADRVQNILHFTNTVSNRCLFQLRGSLDFDVHTW